MGNITLENYYSTEQYKYELSQQYEVLAGLVVSKYVESGSDVHIGHDDNSLLPDIQIIGESRGFEVTSLEHSSDLAVVDLKKEIRNSTVDYYSYLMWKKERKHTLNFYNVKNIINKKHKSVMIESNVCAHGQHWMDEVYKINLAKKLKKLNKGNYARCNDISLITVNITRDKDKNDFDCICDTYDELIVNYNSIFSKLYFLTSSNLWLYENNEKIMVKAFDEKEISYLINEMKRYMNI